MKSIAVRIKKNGESSKVLDILAFDEQEEYIVLPDGTEIYLDFSEFGSVSIIELQDNISELESENRSLEQDNDKLKSQVEYLESGIYDLKYENKDLKNQMDTLEDEIEELNKFIDDQQVPTQ